MDARLRWLVTGVALALLAIAFARFHTELIDDAYISLNYARHLREGHGLVWNPGERVEGYTDFLWVLLLSLGGASPASAAVLGALSAAALLVFLATPSGRLGSRAPLLMFVPLVVAAHLSFAFWAAKGLETALFALCLTCGLILIARRASTRQSLLGVHILCVSALVRPEGALFALLGAAAVGSTTRGRARAAALALPVLLIAPHVIFRLAYYGFPLPNTYYVKVGASAEQFLRGLDYLARFFWHPSALPFLALVLYPRALSWGERFLTAALLAGLLGIVYVGGDAFGAHRFLVPLIPILCLLMLSGLRRAAEQRSLRVGAPAAAAAALVLALNAFAMTARPVLTEEADVVRFTGLMKEVGLLLKRVTPPEFTIALNPAGAVPYYSERRAIDMLGLNDTHIAHSPSVTLGSRRAGHEKGDGDYILARRPSMILIGNVWVDEADTVKTIYPSRRSEVQILKNPELYSLYELVFFELGDGRSLKALVLRDATDLPESGWGPKRYTTIPRGRWK